MEESVFWGVIVEPGKPSAYVPPPEENARLHVSQAVLDPAAEDGARVWLQCKVQDGVPLAVAALRCGGAEAQPLDLILDQYTEFTVRGPAPVHVTGYYIPLEDYDEDEEEEDDGDHEADNALAQQYGLPAGMTLDQMRQMYADGDFDDDEEDDDEDDEDDDDDDEDAAVPVFVGDPSGGAQFGEDESDEVDDDDQDEDEETSDYDSEDEAAGRSKSEVLIEEIDPKQPEEVAKAAGQKRKADAAAMETAPAKKPAVQDGKQSKAVAAAATNGAAKPTNGKQTPIAHEVSGAVAMGEDEDEDERDDDDEEDGDEEDDDDEEEDEEDEEEAEVPLAQQQNMQPQGQSHQQQQKQSAAAKQDGAQPKPQQQQQKQQKQPSIAEAVQQAATTAKAGGQQPAAQKKGKNAKKQKEANGLATPTAGIAGAAANTPATASPGRKSVRRFENGFMMEDTGMGQPDGKLAKGGKRVQMKYVGRLASNGKVFDQTKGNKPFTFRLGVGEVIKGWDRGVEGMRVGDRRKLTIPPSMAYGTKGAPPDIPPNAKLVFDVELVNVL